MQRICALCLTRQILLCGWIFSVVMVNSCEHYFSSFSNVLDMHLEIMVDRGREAPRERRTRDFKSMFAVHSDWTEALHSMFVWFSVSSFSSVSPPLPLHRKRYFLFLYLWQERLVYPLLVIESHHIVSLYICPLRIQQCIYVLIMLILDDSDNRCHAIQIASS